MKKLLAIGAISVLVLGLVIVWGLFSEFGPKNMESSQGAPSQPSQAKADATREESMPIRAGQQDGSSSIDQVDAKPATDTVERVKRDPMRPRPDFLTEPTLKNSLEFSPGDLLARTILAEPRIGINWHKGAPADDLEGALEYDFNMSKDPSTGRIPEGIFEKEKAQANKIVRLQQRNNAVAIGTYAFEGPENLGGRSRSIEYDVRWNGTTNRIILACGVSGGVFKSIDDGATWVRKSPLGDHFSCTSLAQDPRVGSQDTWYYAVGEPLGNSTSGSSAFYLGNGVYKSIDNGETWARSAASNTGALEVFDDLNDLILKVIVNPVNGDVYFASVASILRSTDGGTTWGTVLVSAGPFGSTTTTDIVVTSTGTFYAAFSGTNGVGFDGVWKSTTGAAASWTRIAGAGSATNPAGWNANAAYGRVVLAIAPSLETRVYALYWNGITSACGAPSVEAELYYWDDGMPGAWTAATVPDEAGCLSGNDPFAVQGGYDLVVDVKPDDATTIFIGGTNAYRSTDTGATWTRIAGYASPASYALYASSHPDIHAFAFEPGTSTRMLIGDDGGIQRTTDNTAGTVAWTQINTGFRTYQYYHVVNDPRGFNTKVIGGSQDNGTTRNVGGTGTTFESVFGGDGVSVGLTDLIGGIQYEYVGFQLGAIVRRMSTEGDGFGTTITPTGEADGGLFITIFKLDPDNTENLYYANDNKLYRTTTGSTVTSATWTEMTGIGTAVAVADDISAIALTRGAYAAGTSSLFIGTSGGKVFRLDDPAGVAAATAPVDITGAGFPATGYVSSIAVDPETDDNVLVTFSNYGVVSVFWTPDANVAAPTWTAVEHNLTLPSFRSSAIVTTATAVNYFVGTSAGLYGGTTAKTTPRTAPPAGAFWSQEGPMAMGNAVVSSLDMRAADKKLLVGTHGYGMWSATFGPTAANVSVSGIARNRLGRRIPQVVLTSTDLQGNTRIVKSNIFGYFRFDDLQAGETYTFRAFAKGYLFAPQTISINDNVEGLIFTGDYTKQDVKIPS